MALVSKKGLNVYFQVFWDTINFRFNPFKFDEEEISMEMFEKKIEWF